MAAPFVFIVSCKDETQSIFSSTAVQHPTDETFIDLFRAAAIYNKVDLSSDSVLYANASSNPSFTNPIKVPNLELQVQFAVDIQLRFIEFVLNAERLPSHTKDSTKQKNAFSVLLNAQKKVSLPPKPENILNKKLSGPQQLLCNLIDWGEQLGCGWTQDSLKSGKQVFDKLNTALWYVDHCHEKFKRNGCPIPECFKEFQGYNRFKELRHKPPHVTAEKLHEITEDLVSVVSLPSMSTARNKQLTLHIENLISVFTKYYKRLSDDNERQKSKYQKRDEVNDGDSHCSLISPDGSLGEAYKSLNKVLKEIDDYQYVDLDHYSPSDKIERRKYLKGLKLEMPIMLYRVAYGGSVGTLNFVWSVPEGDIDRSDRNLNVIKTISDQLPKFSSRLMRKEFVEQYINFVKCPKSVLRHMYFNLTGCEETAESSDQHNIDLRVAKKIMNADDPTLLLDLRASNGSESYFDDFFSEMGKYFDEMLLQVHERRHGGELYMPLAISIESLKDAIVKRLPEGTKIPSTETIRLQFSPCNPFERSALKYTSRFDVKFRVQTRLARVDHIDAHYAAKYFQHLKEFCVLHRDHTLFVCMDDKAIIPVGEPGIPISTGVRGHNKVLAPSEGPKLVCTDHDFHVGVLFRQ